MTESRESQTPSWSLCHFLVQLDGPCLPYSGPLFCSLLFFPNRLNDSFFEFFCLQRHPSWPPLSTLTYLHTLCSADWSWLPVHMTLNPQSRVGDCVEVPGHTSKKHILKEPVGLCTWVHTAASCIRETLSSWVLTLWAAYFRIRQFRTFSST